LEEEDQISSEYTYLMKISVIPAFLIWLFLLWRTIVEKLYLISYIIAIAMILSVLQMLLSGLMQIKRLFVNYSTEEFIIRNLSGVEERIPFKELIGYRFKFQKTVKLEFTGKRNRYFRRPLGFEGKSKSYIRQRLDEILLRNRGQNMQ
jgi:hypothetical protein